MVSSGEIRLEGDGEGPALTISISAPGPILKLSTLSIRHGDETEPVVVARLTGPKEAEMLLEALGRLIRAVHRHPPGPEIR